MANSRRYLALLGVAFATFVLCAKADVEDDLRSAFDVMSGPEQIALEALAPSFLDNLVEVAKCVERLSKPIDVCNFKTSYDPLYYLDECTKNTTIGPLIEKFIKSLPVTEANIGIPPVVSKDRCFSLIPPLPPVPTGMPTVPTGAPVVPVPGL